MNDFPVPHDLALQLPLAAGFLKLLLVLVFLVHILFVNFMVGGVTLSFIFEIIGLSRKRYDDLAQEISKTVTVNKSLAIVLGVAPLLVINLVYTIYFYAATSLTGFAWLAVIPLVTVAFLLTYLHKYTWEQWGGRLKALHLTVAGASVALFWFIPLIFLSNVNLMLFPTRWPEVHGFISALLLPNVLLRYLHFMLATVAVSALFAVGYFGREKYPLKEKLPDFERSELLNTFYMIAFIVTLMQLIAGPLNLFTLPVHGISLRVYIWFAIGLSFALLVLWYIWNELKKMESVIGLNYGIVIVLLTATVIAMAFGRHSYRERAIAPYRQLSAEKTEEFYWKSEAARARERMGITKTSYSSAGERDFKKNCSVCHAVDYTLVGPPLKEVAEIYKGNPEGIVTWAKAPGVKRGGPVMPSFAHLDDKTLHGIAEYILASVQPIQ
jgi:cytochrome c